MKYVILLMLVTLCVAGIVTLAQTAAPTTQPTAGATTRPMVMPATQPFPAPMTVAQKAPLLSAPPAEVQGNRGNNRSDNNQSNGNESPPRRAAGAGRFANSDNNPTTVPGLEAENILITPPRDLPADVLDVLGARNIFIKGQQAVPSRDPANSTAAQASTPQGETLVFIGASKMGNEITAYIQDATSETVTEYKTGNNVAGGKITSITLTELDYVTGANTAHIGLGQTLTGNNGWSLLYGVANPTTPTEEPTGPNADLLAKMMARRQQEMSGIAGKAATPAGAPTNAPPGAATQPSPGGPGGAAQ
ncbi:MAG: hypothetical protein M3O30_14365 [Planctomycetota bacterium]|nr:hypothetical protein [Planctomycetota bacterium]